MICFWDLFSDYVHWSQGDDKVGIARNNSGEVLTRTVNSRRRPSDPLLLLTISIHHLESNDYVDDVDHNTETPTVFDNKSHESGSSIHTEHEKLNKALSRKRDSDSGEPEKDPESKELLEVMVVLYNKRDLFLKILKNPRAFVNFLESGGFQFRESVGQIRFIPSVRFVMEQNNDMNTERRKF